MRGKRDDRLAHEHAAHVSPSARPINIERLISCSTGYLLLSPLRWVALVRASGALIDNETARLASVLRNRTRSSCTKEISTQMDTTDHTQEIGHNESLAVSIDAGGTVV